MAGQTLAALQAGSLAYKLVVAIEGYPYLLTDASTAAAVTAHGGDWTQALAGLVVDLKQSQKIDPWDPLQGGGTATLYVPQGPDDQFGIDTHKTSGGIETELSTTVDRNDSLAVRSNALFSAAGDAYIGTEAIAYTGKVATTGFSGVTRGKYSPFAAGGTGTPRFTHDHRVGSLDYATALAPIVSTDPRTWVGRWVGIWAHVITSSSGDICSKAEAHLLFAGKVVEIRDDPETMCTVVQLRHVLDVVKETVVGRDQYEAEIAQGIYLNAGLKFSMSDGIAGSTVYTATDLVVVASGAAGANQVDAGYYTLDEIYSFLNNWWGSEIVATRLSASYYFIHSGTITGGIRCKIRFKIAGAATQSVTWIFKLPLPVADLMGFSGLTTVEGHDVAALDTFRESGSPPSSVPVFVVDPLDTSDIRAKLTNETGIFVDNYATLPAGPPGKNFKPASSLSLEWGVFLVDNARFIRAAKSGTELRYCIPAPMALAGVDAVNQALTMFARPIDAPSPIKIRQILMIESTLAGLIKLLFYNTGTSGYNHATYDVLGLGFGIGLPGALLGTAFEASVDALPGADKPILAIIEKPAKLGGDNGVLSGDLLLRRAFPVWRSGGLLFTAWQTPSYANAIADLGEGSKAAPAGNSEDHRATSTLASEWVRNIVKIEYNRDITQLSGGAFGDYLTLVDNTAIDDAGGEGKTFTISARNTYSQYENTGSGVEDLAPGFLSSFPLFSRPMRLVRRSIYPRLFEGYAPGDIVTVTDKFARDPSTGRRIISARPGIITRHQYSLGGANPGDPSSVRGMTGEIDVAFLDLNRIGPYAPSASIDDTYTSGGYTNGYNNGTLTIRCKVHEYSEAAESIDASNFAIGDKVVMTEIDPAAVASPITWTRTISSVSSSDITFTAALAAPAFDTTKKYAITFDHYAVAQSTQLTKAFQADTDALLEDIAPPFQYGLTTSATTTTASVHTDLPELPASLSYGDGKARDVGFDRGLSRLLNNIHDHKTRHQSPALALTVMTNTTYAGYKLLAIEPVWLTMEVGTATTFRFLRVAPWYRSSDGTSVNVRVSLCANPPTGTTLSNTGVTGGMDRGSTYAEAIWTTSSTTWQQGAEQELTCAVKNGFTGVAFLVIEGSQKAETRGLGQCNEAQRYYIP